MSHKSLSLTRRELARLALAGTASALLMTSSNTPAAHAAASDTPKPDEGAALAEALPGAAGYAPSDSQTREAMAALKGYPGGFDKARAFPLSNDMEPAFLPYAPPLSPKKGASR